MSDFVCSECGMVNIDCGKLGYKTDKEIKLGNENAKLKELLKECVEVLNDAQRNYGYDDSIIDICSPIITKIDEVLK